MSLLGSVGAALQRLDRRIAGGNPMAGIFPLTTQTSIRVAQGTEGERLISHDDVVQSNPVVFGVWSRVVRELATTEIVVEQYQDGGRWAQVHDHEIEHLLRNPADRLGLIDTLQWIVNPLHTEGNGLIAKYKEPDSDPKKPPSALLPLDWRYMSAWARRGGPVQLWGSMITGEWTAIDPTEVVHVAWDPPTAGAIGVSALVALGTAVRVDDAGSRLLEAQYNNGLHFGGFLSFPKDATPDQIPDDPTVEKMKERWKEAYGGVDNAFKIAVLQGGLQFEKVSMTIAEAELLAARDVAAGDVYRAFGHRRSDFEDTQLLVPIEDRNRSLHRALIPSTGLIAGCINRQLIDPEPDWQGFRMRFDLSGLLRGTYKEELENAVYAFTNGMTTRNESRVSIGLAEDENPDTKDESNTLMVPHAQIDPAGGGVDNRTLPPTDRNLPSRQTRDVPGTGSAG